ncbi:MAG: helix-turn-helix transcriptional regulator [Methylobacterium mesophilicum]|nr:helix-turn-helix transcriptional regulator [Methylobacterium mesophilicum]
MDSRIEGFTPLEPLCWRGWAGAVADIWTVACAPNAGGRYVSPHSRLFVLLESEGEGAIWLAAEGDDVTVKVTQDNPVAFVPAGCVVYSRVEGIRRLCHLDIHFDLGALRRRTGPSLDANRLAAPRLGFAEPRIAALAALVADELRASKPLGDAYGEGLVAALFLALCGAAQRPRAAGPRLAPAQLARVTSHLDENALRNVRLEELAGLAGLSPSYFANAFKASSGVTAQQYHAEARLARVKALLSGTDTPLNALALMTGFADQAHLTRVFRRLTGTTPAAWRREHVAKRS